MKTAPVLGITRSLSSLAAVLVALTGCASAHKTPPAAQATQPTAPSAAATPPSPLPKRAESMPPGRTHGMPYTSAVPDPAWYAQRFNRARGVGEAMRRDHVTQWDKDAMAYTYYVGGVLYAHYQPYQHNLSIRTDNGGEAETTCEWDANGTLTMTPAGNQDICKQLLGELDQHIARTGHFPPIDGVSSR